MLTSPCQEVTPQRSDSKRHLGFQGGAVNERYEYMKDRLMTGGYKTGEMEEEMLERAGHQNDCSYTGIVKISAKFVPFTMKKNPKQSPLGFRHSADANSG